MEASAIPTYNFNHWGKLPKVSCLCPTYGRPHLLGEAIESFLRQDYPGEKELIILNDQPEVTLALGDLKEVRLVNASARYLTLGQKRNALAERADSEILFVWDDDDISLPWRISVTIERMRNHHHFIANNYWRLNDTGISYQKYYPIYGTSAYSRELFQRVNGHPHMDSGEDREFDNRLKPTGLYDVHTLEPAELFYVYRLQSDTYHATWDNADAVARRAKRRTTEKACEIIPGWKQDYAAMTRPRKILIGVCSCHGHEEQCQTVRETWMSSKPAKAEARFFVGDGAQIQEPDTVSLIARDGYDDLPHKVIQFFRWALQNSDFEYLYKCDDDTYVDVERLQMLTVGNPDLVGNPFLNDNRHFACGGAGYLLARKWIEEIVKKELPKPGYEDRIVTGAAMRLGAIPTVNGHLHWNFAPYPRADNSHISCHHCSPKRMRAIHTIRYKEPSFELKTGHPQWEHGGDTLQFFNNGVFRRLSTECAGNYQKTDQYIRLNWFDWNPEIITPRDDYWIVRSNAADTWDIGGQTFIVSCKSGWTNFDTSDIARRTENRAGIAMWRDPLRRVVSMYRDCFHKRVKSPNVNVGINYMVTALCKFYKCEIKELPHIPFDTFVRDLPEMVERDLDNHLSPICLAVAKYDVTGICDLDKNSKALDDFLGNHKRNESSIWCDVDTTIASELEAIIRKVYVGDYQMLSKYPSIKL